MDEELLVDPSLEQLTTKIISSAMQPNATNQIDSLRQIDIAKAARSFLSLASSLEVKDRIC